MRSHPPSTPQIAIAPLQLPKQRSHPSTPPNSDRIPSTPKKRSHPSPQLPKHSFFNEPQRHREHRERAIAPLQLPKSDRTPSTPQTAIAPLQLPNILF
ncbi:hypothetical protein [Anabaena sp. UHCC 0451]|uniref:hypothetical protein n=1 Tax=Anabaena sp. UHCC 0451 TaxID=2055235 RepID=UPI002B1EBB2C|nr:hypothetical protein [Anabaena sp. UHCC 0451]MEA5577116.1 hypothetical protein [Anabaena sp. UHCC 0451]